MPTSPAAPAALTSPPIGAPWPGQGGIYAGICRGEAGQPDHHLILAEARLGRLAWGRTRAVIAGAGNNRDGLANTRALLASKTPHPAAQACAAVTADGHSDFYLPSRFELALLYANLRERFEPTWHWSSTQLAGEASCAWKCYFLTGTQDYTHKSFQGCAVAVRRVAIQSFNPSSPLPPLERELLTACQGLLHIAETGVMSLGTVRAAHAVIAKAAGSAA